MEKYLVFFFLLRDVIRVNFEKEKYFRIVNFIYFVLLFFVII